MSPLNLSAHHAHILIGDFNSAYESILETVTAVIGQPALRHPDVWVEFFPAFKVDHSRLVKERQQSRPVAAERKFFVLGLGSITVAAQNALLKVLEEPSSLTTIILVASSSRLFLPTVLSRCQLVSSEFTKPPILPDSEIWLDASKSERLAMTSTWRLDKKLTKSFTQDFLNSLELSLASQLPAARLALPLVTARKYIYDQAFMPKLVFEYLALTMPSRR